MKEFISLFLGSVTLAATVRMATPILFTALGGCFSQKAGTFCIAFECFMLSAAFFAAYGSYLTGSPYVGTLFAIATGVLLAGFYGLFVYTFHANAVIVSIAFNFGAWAGTTLLLTKLFGVRGYFFSPKIKGFSSISVPLLSLIPYLRDIFNRQSLLFGNIRRIDTTTIKFSPQNPSLRLDKKLLFKGRRTQSVVYISRNKV